MARQREEKSGLRVGGKVHIVSDKKALPLPLCILFRAILAEGMLLCVYALFREALPVEAESKTILLVASFCTLLFLIALQKKELRAFVYLGTAVGAAAFLWWKQEAFLAGAKAVLSVWSVCFEEYTGYSLFALGEVGSVAETTLFLSCLFGLYAFSTARMLATGKGRGVSLLATLLLAAQPFLIGKLPLEWALIALIGLVLAGTAMDGTVLFPLREGAAFYVLALYGAALLLSFGFVTRERYDAFDVSAKKEAVNTALESFSPEQAALRLEAYWQERLTALQKRVTNLWEGTGFLEESEALGGLDGGRLFTGGEVRFTNETMLSLTLPKDGGMFYLKGYAGSHYTGTAWETLSEEEETKLAALLAGSGYRLEELQQLPLRLAEETGTVPEQYSLHIRYAGANKNYLYVPYGTTTDWSGLVRAEADLFLYPAGTLKGEKKQYDCAVYQGVGNGWNKLPLLYTGEAAKDLSKAAETPSEELYAAYVEWVEKTYTALPEGIERVKALAAESGLTERATTEQKVNWVRTYLSEHTRYSLTPGALPKGEEYVEYFLFSNKQGYCAHYASAAVLLLRCMGVPARYAEGYVVLPESYENGTVSKAKDGSDRITIEIKDTNAHAWAEVFYPECGWVPTEVTAAYVPEEMPDVTPSPSPSPALAPTVTQAPLPTEKPQATLTPPAEPDSVPDVKVTEIPSDTKQGEETGGESGNGVKEQQEKQEEESWSKGQIWKAIWFAVAALTAVLLLTNRRRFFEATSSWLCRVRKRRVLRHTPKEQIILWYFMLQRLLRLYEKPPSEELSEKEHEKLAGTLYPFLCTEKYEELRTLAYAMQFGKKEAGEAEAKRAEELYLSLSESLYEKLSAGKRFWFWLLLAR